MIHYDVAVIGVGAMGSASLYQLSKKGLKIIGIDSFAPPHNQGSSHGESRIIRQAIGEGKHYVPLAMRSYEIWQEIEQYTGQRLLNYTGGLVLASKDQADGFFSTTLKAAQDYGIKHEVLDYKVIKERFKEFNVSKDIVGYYEHKAGFVVPEECVGHQIALAKERGAEVRFNEVVTKIERKNGHIVVQTNQHQYTASKVIISNGPWIQNLIPDWSQDIFSVYRQVLYWFEILDDRSFHPSRFPIFIWKLSEGVEGIYGFPAIHGQKGGIKIAAHAMPEPTSPDLLNRQVSDQEKEEFYQKYVMPYFSALIGPHCIKAVVCPYTMTPDENFIIDFLPECEDILVVSCCSGHGFKHSAAIGEITAECVLGNVDMKNLNHFSLKRFRSA